MPYISLVILRAPRGPPQRALIRILNLVLFSNFSEIATTQSLVSMQARTQQGAQRARAPPLATVYSTVEYYDLLWHKRRRNINEHANVVQYKFHVKNAINSLYILSISWPEV